MGVKLRLDIGYLLAIVISIIYISVWLNEEREITKSSSSQLKEEYLDLTIQLVFAYPPHNNISLSLTNFPQT